MKLSHSLRSGRIHIIYFIFFFFVHRWQKWDWKQLSIAFLAFFFCCFCFAFFSWTSIDVTMFNSYILYWNWICLRFLGEDCAWSCTNICHASMGKLQLHGQAWCWRALDDNQLWEAQEEEHGGKKKRCECRRTVMPCNNNCNIWLLSLHFQTSVRSGCCLSQFNEKRSEHFSLVR